MGFYEAARKYGDMALRVIATSGSHPSERSAVAP
jgi:hypothetical protein